MLAASAVQAQSLVRDASHFQWYVIPLLLIVLYAYVEQVAQRRWNIVLAALAFWLMDWVNEIWNALLFHFSGFAPAWGTPGNSAYVLLIGLNIEISFMFAIMGLMSVRMLPSDPGLRVFGIPNRWLLAICNSILCVMVELWLNRIGVLTWEWPWWNVRAPWLIFLIGYLPFFLVAYWVHDMASRKHQLWVVGLLAMIVAASLTLFAGILNWI